MNTKKAAKELELVERTIRRYCRSGRIPAVKIGGTWRIENSVVWDIKKGLLKILKVGHKNDKR